MRNFGIKMAVWLIILGAIAICGVVIWKTTGGVAAMLFIVAGLIRVNVSLRTQRGAAQWRAMVPP
ncbi:hypothetical protein [Paracoccus sp. (in: a-proteobacteria)]|uniref:hypothetical protein n=1 Tax=Paracoccus sp. TaxID=267 RepID=UPI0026DF9A04|nr:hypothetical protein [Paracoccus sp. (in: a-proteobacteria)]MDO5646619.1 hypothetical protein [Paracoccus sp. (in: a-proteobacteria)]